MIAVSNYCGKPLDSMHAVPHSTKACNTRAQCGTVCNAAASTVDRMDILTKNFTYELVMFILIINNETFSHILVRNESTTALLEGKLLNMTESIFYMQFKMTRPDMA